MTVRVAGTDLLNPGRAGRDGREGEVRICCWEVCAGGYWEEMVVESMWGCTGVWSVGKGFVGCRSGMKSLQAVKRVCEEDGGMRRCVKGEENLSAVEESGPGASVTPPRRGSDGTSRTNWLRRAPRQREAGELFSRLTRQVINTRGLVRQIYVIILVALRPPPSRTPRGTHTTDKLLQESRTHSFVKD